MVNKKYSFKRLVFWTLIIVSSVFLYTQAKDYDSKKVKIEVEAYWTYEKQQETVIARGQTNLPQGTILKLYLKGGINCLNGNRVEMFNMARCLVDNRGKYSVKWPQSEGPFWAEQYEIEVGIDPNRVDEKLLLKKGFTRKDIKNAKGYYHLYILSPVLIKRRIKRAKTSYDTINSLYELDKDLKNHIKTIEEAKKEEKEVSKELIEDWSKWEVKWSKQLGQIRQIVDNENILLETREKISSEVQELEEIHTKYQYVIGNIPKNTIVDYSTEKIITNEYNWSKAPDQTRRESQGLLRRELVYKILKDISGWLDAGVDNFKKGKKSWSKFKQKGIRYGSRIEEEYAYYTTHKIFERESGHKDAIIELINGLEDLSEKASLALTTESNNEESQKEINDLAVQLVNKINELLNNLRTAPKQTPPLPK